MATGAGTKGPVRATRPCGPHGAREALAVAPVEAQVDSQVVLAMGAPATSKFHEHLSGQEYPHRHSEELQCCEGLWAPCHSGTA